MKLRVPDWVELAKAPPTAAAAAPLREVSSVGALTFCRLPQLATKAAVQSPIKKRRGLKKDFIEISTTHGYFTPVREFMKHRKCATRERLRT
jgi:hypothetical protein